MAALRGLNVLLSFVLELCMLVIFAAYGISIGSDLFAKITLGVAFVVVPVWFWGAYMAPRAKRRIPWPWTPIVALLLFFTAVLVLLMAGWSKVAVVMAVAIVLNAALTFIFHSQNN